MTTNKEQAQARLTAIEDGLRTLNDEAAALRSIIEAPEPVDKKPLVQAKETRGYIVVWTINGYFADTHEVNANGFEAPRQAEAYAEAFNTLLDLRRQPGSEAAEEGKGQFFIGFMGSICSYPELDMKLERLCPMFDSSESALAAREAVGWDRIMRMYNTLHGRGYD